MVGWYLASRLLNLAYPFQKRTLIMAQPILFFTIYESAGGVKESCIIVSFLILERICYVASTPVFATTSMAIRASRTAGNT